VTAVLVVPVTGAVNCWVVLMGTDAVAGLIGPTTTFELIVTVAVADTLVSAAEVAFTVTWLG
jgi:hypothetical protein